MKKLEMLAYVKQLYSLRGTTLHICLLFVEIGEFFRLTLAVPTMF